MTKRLQNFRSRFESWWGHCEIGDRINTIIGEYSKANGLTCIIAEAEVADSHCIPQTPERVSIQ